MRRTRVIRLRRACPESVADRRRIRRPVLSPAPPPRSAPARLQRPLRRASLCSSTNRRMPAVDRRFIASACCSSRRQAPLRRRARPPSLYDDRSPLPSTQFCAHFRTHRENEVLFAGGCRFWPGRRSRQGLRAEPIVEQRSVLLRAWVGLPFTANESDWNGMFAAISRSRKSLSARMSAKRSITRCSLMERASEICTVDRKRARSSRSAAYAAASARDSGRPSSSSPSSPPPSPPSSSLFPCVSPLAALVSRRRRYVRSSRPPSAVPYWCRSIAFALAGQSKHQERSRRRTDVR